MTVMQIYKTYKDILEYHGSTTVERIRKRGQRVIRRDWIEFDSVEDAQAYFDEAEMAV